MTRPFGRGDFRYDVVEDWGRGSAGGRLGLVSSIAVDSDDRVFVFQRKPDPLMLVFDRDGTRLGSWGEGLFREPHGVWIGPDDAVFTADSGDHTVRRFSRDGTLVQTWGTPNEAGAPDRPFNRPTWGVVGPSGDLFVSDGYGQNRWHRLGMGGELLGSWGGTGSGPGEFRLPHAIWVDRAERVYVTDRTNNRVQIFSPTGEYLTEWPDLLAPNQVFIDEDDTVYIAEGGRRISIMALDGTVLARWGEEGEEPGQFRDSPHSVWVDSHGDLYISEVLGEDRFQKFVRR
jgi:DNA-binding beta-propeller fold protein YncE